MAEWWTYSLSDFLLFAPRTYYRLFELTNEALWPAHIAALALGGAILALARHGGTGPARLARRCWHSPGSCRLGLPRRALCHHQLGGGIHGLGLRAPGAGAGRRRPERHAGSTRAARDRDSARKPWFSSRSFSTR